MLMGTHWCNNGNKMQGGSWFQHHISFFRENTVFHGLELIVSCHNHDWMKSVLFSCHIAVEHIWTYSHIWPQDWARKPSRTGVNLGRLEKHWCIISSSVATVAMVLKHQAISSHSADKIFFVLNQFYTRILQSLWKTLWNKNRILKNYTQLFKGESLN